MRSVVKPHESGSVKLEMYFYAEWLTHCEPCFKYYFGFSAVCLG